MEELWKTYDGGLHSASSLGRIRNNKTGKILKPYRNSAPSGHEHTDMRITYRVNGKSKTFKVHRLVAKAFLNDYSDDLTVDHINNDSTDNRVENLRMATMKENMNNPITVERCRNNPACKKNLGEFMGNPDLIRKAHKERMNKAN